MQGFRIRTCVAESDKKRVSCRQKSDGARKNYLVTYWVKIKGLIPKPSYELLGADHIPTIRMCFDEIRAKLPQKICMT